MSSSWSTADSWRAPHLHRCGWTKQSSRPGLARLSLLKTCWEPGLAGTGGQKPRRQHGVARPCSYLRGLLHLWLDGVSDLRLGCPSQAYQFPLYFLKSPRTFTHPKTLPGNRTRQNTEASPSPRSQKGWLWPRARLWRNGRGQTEAVGGAGSLVLHIQSLILDQSHTCSQAWKITEVPEWTHSSEVGLGPFLSSHMLTHCSP